MIARHIALSAIQLTSLAAALASQVLLARQIGPGAELDLYFAAFGFATAFVGGVGVAATYLVPAYIHQRAGCDSDARQAAGSCVVALGSCALVLAAVSGALFAADHHASQTLREVPGRTVIIALCWMSAIAAALASIWSAVGSAYRWVEWPMALATLAPVATLICLAAPGPVPVTAVAAAQCTGVVIQAAALATLLRRRWTIRSITRANVGRILAATPVAALGALCFSGYSAIDAVIAPGLGEGVMSHQALAQRLLIAFSAVLSAGPFMLAPSRVAEMLAQDERHAVWRYLLRSSVAMCLCCWLAAVLALNPGRMVIEVFFEHGAFDAQDTDAVTRSLSCLLIGAGPMLSTAIAFRVLHALGRHGDVAAISCCWLALYAASSWGLADRLGSIALSTSYSGSWVTAGALAMLRAHRLLRLSRRGE